MKLRTFSISALGIAAALALAGCAQGDSMEGMDHGSAPSADASAPANSADIEFASMMIPHHEQAVEMSDILLAKEDINEPVIELATQIRNAQAPEIETMQQWLDEWGVESSGAMGDMDHNGMMSEGDLTDLADSEGTAAARLFLEQMLLHHEGAIEMAQTEVDNGENPDAVELAQMIIDTQSDEISTIEFLLQEL